MRCPPIPIELNRLRGRLWVFTAQRSKDTSGVPYEPGVARRTQGYTAGSRYEKGVTSLSPRAGIPAVIETGSLPNPHSALESSLATGRLL